MAAIQALQTAGGTLRRNPILFAVAAAISLFQLPSLVAQYISPLFGSLVSLAFSGLLIFVMPFFIGGVIGMANEAITGRTSLGTFVDEGKAHYVSILVVYFGLILLNFVLGFVGVFVVGFGGVFVFASGTDPSLALLGVIAVIGLAILFTYLAVVFVAQFFGHAIVVDDLSAVDGIKRSVWCVRNNLLSVLGYTVVVTVGGAVLGLFGGLFSLLTTPAFPAQDVAEVGAAPPSASQLLGLPSIGLAGTAVLVVLLVLFSSLLGAFFAAYSTAFYRSIRPVQGNATGEN